MSALRLRNIFLNALFLSALCSCYQKSKPDIPLAEAVEKGRSVYIIFCTRCHMLDGKGVPGTYPPLYNSDYLMEDRERSIEIALNGMDGEITVNGENYSGTMEKLEMTDEEIAYVLTFLRTNMGNSGDAVTVEDVARVRKRMQKKDDGGQKK